MKKGRLSARSAGLCWTRMKDFKSEIVIGLEVHIELDTKTKMFCGCPTKADEPNSAVCPVCLGHPGSKPVLNKRALEYALKLCLALGCKISPELIFSRKSYFYPDMAKNYQISQYEIPLGKKGKLKLSSGKSIGITRVHMEEDPAALVHPETMAKSKYVLVDYNRSGRPLVEVVTEPDLTSPEEAREFLNKLITILKYLEIFDINKCIIKADANISVKESGYTKVEIKNISGFKEIESALFYEVERQKENPKEIKQETRAWDSELGATRAMRTKETAEDYGYIIDTDLVPIEITPALIKKTKQEMPELAESKIEKYVVKHKISELDAKAIAQEKLLADLFEKVAAEIDPGLAAKWLRRELVRVLNYNRKSLKDLEIDERHLVDLLKLIETKQITDNVGQKILEKLIEKPFDVKEYVKKEGLSAVSDVNFIEKICKNVMTENKKAINDYKKGEEKALHFLIGKVMAKTKGKATPREVNEILKRLIK